MTIVQRKIRMLREINPSLNNAKIIVRKSRRINDVLIGDDFIIDDQQVDRIVFGLGRRIDSNFDYVCRLLRRRLGHSERLRRIKYGYVSINVFFELSSAYQFQKSVILYDNHCDFVSDFGGPSYNAIVHANDVTKFVRNSGFEADGEYIDPLESEETNVYIHSITSVPPDGLYELMMSNATVHLVINEWVLDKIIERTWG